MSNHVKVKYSIAESLIEEGDILLFRGTGLISSLIKIAGHGNYSHIAIASKHDNYWEAIEYREWYGGRTVHLENYIRECQKNKTEIDVYRPCKYFSSLKFNQDNYNVDYSRIKFDGNKVTNCMRELTGLPYSYKRIWLLLKIHLFRLHLYKNLDKITNEIPSNEIILPVCSTVLAHCFAKNNYLILRNRSDQYIEPSDFSISPRLNYLFTPYI